MEYEIRIKSKIGEVFTFNIVKDEQGRKRIAGGNKPWDEIPEEILKTIRELI